MSEWQQPDTWAKFMVAAAALAAGLAKLKPARSKRGSPKRDLKKLGDEIDDLRKDFERLIDAIQTHLSLFQQLTNLTQTHVSANIKLVETVTAKFVPGLVYVNKLGTIVIAHDNRLKALELSPAAGKKAPKGMKAAVAS